jgi:hypothetical protein
MDRRCSRLVLVTAVLTGCASGEQMPADAGARDALSQQQTDARAQTDAASGSSNPDAASVDAGSSSACAYSGVLATWSFTGATGSQTSTTASSTATNVTAGAISRMGVTATSGSGSINAINWTTSASLDPAKYYTFTITPPAGCTLSLTGAAIDGKSSATGPTMAVIGTSKDGFAATTALSTSAASTPTLSVTGVTSTLELRVYGFAAGSTSGSFRLQNTLTLSGSIQ